LVIITIITLPYYSVRLEKEKRKILVENINQNYVILIIITKKSIGHFTVVCLVTWPLNASEARGDLALIQTSLLFHLNAN